MTIANFLLVMLVFTFAAYGVFIIIDTLNYDKEQNEKEEWRKTLAQWDEQKRKEREAFDKQRFAN
jgi:large-conductance mechanosensitive channel